MVELKVSISEVGSSQGLTLLRIASSLVRNFGLEGVWCHGVVDSKSSHLGTERKQGGKVSGHLVLSGWGSGRVATLRAYLLQIWLSLTEVGGIAASASIAATGVVLKAPKIPLKALF